MPNPIVGLGLAITINSANATTVLSSDCACTADYYACLITEVINLYNSDGWHGQSNIPNNFIPTYQDQLFALCDKAVGTCVNRTSYIRDYKSYILENSVLYGVSYAYDMNVGDILEHAQRAIEIEVLMELINQELCLCDWKSEYIYPRNTFGAGPSCATCPDNGVISSDSSIPMGIQSCEKLGNVPFTDSVGSGYQAGPCRYIPASSDWRY